MDSDNDVTLKLKSDLDVKQDNDFDCGKGDHGWGEWYRHDENNDCNDIDVDLDTGDNDANENTHFDGDPGIETGDANSDVDVSNEANSNTVGNVDVEGDSINIDINLEGLLALLLGLLD